MTAEQNIPNASDLSIDPSQKWVESLPVAAQQALKLVGDKETWTTQKKESLSICFEQLMAQPNIQELFLDAASSSQSEQADTNTKQTLQLLAYLRIEQAMLFLRTIPDAYEIQLIKEINSPDTHSAIERVNLISRLETLSKLNMLSRIFSPERRVFVMSVIQKTAQEIR